MKKITRTLMVVLLILFTSGLAGCLDKADSPVVTPTPEPMFDAEGIRYGQYGSAVFHGSVIVENDLTVSDDVTITDDFTIAGDLDVDGTTNLDVTDVDGAVQIDADATQGVNGTGWDWTWYSDTSDDLMRWEASAEQLVITGTAGAIALQVVAGNVDVDGQMDVDGNVTFGSDGVGYDVTFESDTGSDLMRWQASTESLVITGTAAAAALTIVDGNIDLDDDIDVDGTTNLDVTDVDGALQVDADTTFGVSGTGWDVTFHSDTGDDHMRWEASSKALVITGTAAADALNIADGNLTVVDDLDIGGTTNLDVVDIDGAVDIDADVTFGTNGTSYDVTWFSDTSDDLMRWEASAEQLVITGTATAVALQVVAGNVDIDGDVVFGSDGVGYDVYFNSDTGSDLMMWNAADEQLVITGTNATTALNVTDGNVAIVDDLDVDGTTNLDVVDIDGAVDFESTIVPNGFINHGCVYSETTGTTTMVAVASCYVFEPGAALTVTLGTSGVTTGTQLILLNVANQDIIIPDTNIRTTDGNLITMNQYDISMWIFDGTDWFLLVHSGNS